VKILNAIQNTVAEHGHNSISMSFLLDDNTKIGKISFAIHQPPLLASVGEIFAGNLFKQLLLLLLIKSMLGLICEKLLLFFRSTFFKNYFYKN